MDFAQYIQTANKFNILPSVAILQELLQLPI